jgi:hypothetical protein
VKRLRIEALNFDGAYFCSHRAAQAAKAVMEKFTHDDIRNVYRKQHYIK